MKYDFSGKIVLYLLKSDNEEDFPPASINLYARENKEPFSFAWVIEKCGFERELKDADKIIFYGGESHTLCVKNSGDATILYCEEVLLRNKKYPLSYNEKLLMIFNHGEIEMEAHYKNIKPSERRR